MAVGPAAVYYIEPIRAETVGQAIKESGLARSELYITSKYARGEIQLSVRASLYLVRPSSLRFVYPVADAFAQLKLQYLDLYLIHSPSFVPDIEAGWKQFERIKDDGLSK